MASTKSSTDQCGWNRENAGRVVGNGICIYFCFALTASGTLISLGQIIQGHVGSHKDSGSYSKVRWETSDVIRVWQTHDIIKHFLKDCTDSVKNRL